MKKLLLLGTLAALSATMLAVGISRANITQTKVAEPKHAHEITLIDKPQAEFLAGVPALKASAPSWKESFEGWDHKDYYWLPEGWSRICSDEALKANNNTWFMNVQMNEYAPEPVDGKVYAEILFTDKYDQDEWLISPEVTPQDGESLQFTVTYAPFSLFDFQYYVGKDKEFSQRVCACNFQAYVSVDGGEWIEVYNAWEEHKGDNAWKMRVESSYGPTNFTIKSDLSAYAGKHVKFGFRYSGKDGDSMFLDNILVGKPYVVASYSNPSSLYLGMNRYCEIPAPYMFVPDSVALTFANTSSSDCESFSWNYMDADRNPATSNSKNLTLTYAHKPEQVGSIDNSNIYDLPTLTATATGVPADTYQSENGKMKVGGKTYVKIDGEEFHLGAGTYNPLAGATAMIGDNKEPIFGCRNGEVSQFWANYAYGRIPGADTTFTVKAIYNGFDAPAKPYKVRGLWVHAIGEIFEGANVVASIHKLTDAGAIDNDNVLGSAILNVDSVITQDAGGVPIMYIPFVFDDPVTVDQTVFVRISGIDDPNVGYFAPMQSLVPDSYSHGYVSLYMTQGSKSGSTMIPLSYVSTEQYGPCNNSFYITLDAAYGDCDDWGHISGENYIPDIEVLTNVIHLENTEKEYEEHNLRSAFYNDTKQDSLKLYVCAGAMDWGNEINDTYHLTITLPKTALGDTLNLYEKEATVSYYDIATESTVCVATSGELCVTQTGEHAYTVYLRAYDRKAQIAFSAKYNKGWKDFTAVKPNPNQYSVGTAVTSLGSCVIDQSDKSAIKIYLSHAEGVKSVDEMLALTSEKPIVITADEQYITGQLVGFSQVKDTTVNINFRGNDYNYVSCNIEPTNAIGGNITVLIDGNNTSVDFTIYSVDSENNHNVKAHYAGVFFPLNGDLNGDGVVDVADMNIVIDIILNIKQLSDYPAADINGDDTVDVADLNAIINLILGL